MSYIQLSSPARKRFFSSVDIPRFISTEVHSQDSTVSPVVKNYQKVVTLNKLHNLSIFRKSTTCIAKGDFFSWPVVQKCFLENQVMRKKWSVYGINSSLFPNFVTCLTEILRKSSVSNQTPHFHTNVKLKMVRNKTGDLQGAVKNLYRPVHMKDHVWFIGQYRPLHGRDPFFDIVRSGTWYFTWTRLN